MIQAIRARMVSGLALLGLVLVPPAGHAAGGDPAGDELPDGRAIYARYVEAVGGDEALRAVRSFHVRGRYELPAFEVEGTIELFYDRQEGLRYVADLGKLGRTLRGFHDGIAWVVDARQGARLQEGPERNDTRRWVLRGFSLLPDPSVYRTIETVEKTRWSDHEVHKVRLVLDETEAESFEYFEVESGLLVGREESFRTPAGPVRIEGDFAGYERFGDLLVATICTHRAANQEWTAIYERFDVNEVDPGALVPPAEVRKLAEATVVE